MKIRKGALVITLLMAAHICNAAVQPSGSRFDPRNQIVSYNPQNTTVINSAVGYTTTLVFDDDETVISARTGFPQGWSVNKEDNLVYVEVKPVKQTVQNNNTDENGKQSSEVVNVALDPETDLERWRTNLFVRTTKRNYSMELNARTFRQPDKIAFVVNYQYPQERRKEQAEIEKKRIEAYNKRQEEKTINNALENAKSPRNWQYWKRVAEGSQDISPDYAYDDGRYTWFGFSPLKKIPSIFVMSGDQETLTNPVVKKSSSFTVVGVPVDQHFVLRIGNQVVGVENRGFGKVRLPAGDTVSPKVEKEVIQ
ncbi:TPA: TrbG/VirB9 family P-type conjugative transfer protein [Escherichia coli]|uniref:TrbG/VirB9 family P-type conjugative transfer protein n=1 Tax=Enterobacteriaceae TaxID=543 RepID=UPI0015FB8508|nr:MULTISPECIES: TrbG/VirB9 family P-type conjugative transfer protein [Citrobacter]MBA7759978.1 TrbG/VirB9 family P-type conjugative transfer protein [Citrobacter sp. RHBSTW-00325]MBA7994439.1 TrbG/VirB9 family P-type conjugative transfer protein [Citrobacter freundii]MBA8090450.1 TrbG/VirB9 family P-type conjugative transfer protein [Citrobacter sp. RHBSTW-00089]HAT1567623.1 TrbG/VirB9 family P-type conjugative transfer protein [Citrobacter freundii]